MTREVKLFGRGLAKLARVAEADTDNRAWPLLIRVEEDTEEKAWTELRDQLEFDLSFLNGHKYWRLPPTLDERRDFESGETCYAIVARLFVVHKPLEGMEEIDLSKPYPKDVSHPYEDDPGIMGFGLK